MLSIVQSRPQKIYDVREALFYAIARSGEMLFRIPAKSPGDGGPVQSLARKKIEYNETPQQAAMQAMIDTVGRQPLHVLDFGYAPLKPGNGAAYVAYNKFNTDLPAIVRGLQLGANTLGVIALKADKLAHLVDGAGPVWINFLPAKTAFIQSAVRAATREAKAGQEPLTIGHLLKGVTSSAMPISQVPGPASLRPVEIMVEAADFVGRHDHLAIGLEILMAATNMRMFAHAPAGKAYIKRAQALATLLPRTDTQFGIPRPDASMLR